MEGMEGGEKDGWLDALLRVLQRLGVVFGS